MGYPGTGHGDGEFNLRERGGSGTSLVRASMPELDTIRGIAILLVLFFHGFGLRYGLRGLSGFPKLLVAATLPGWMGVNLFFVLSGFLITGILLDSKSRPNYFRVFYIRRALRILPLYYGVLLLLAVLTRTGWVNRHASWAYLGLSAIYLSNVTELFGVPSQYTVLWSLAVEEHFYLLWPAAIRVLSRYQVVVAGAVICVVCPCLRAFYSIAGYNADARYTWLVADGLEGWRRRLDAIGEGRVFCDRILFATARHDRLREERHSEFVSSGRLPGKHLVRGQSERVALCRRRNELYLDSKEIADGAD